MRTGLLTRAESGKLIDLPQHCDQRGTLTVIEGGGLTAPFDIKRVYILSDVVEDAVRGAHGHKELKQVFVCLSGSVKIDIYDGYNKVSHFLDKSSYGLYVSERNWRELSEFSHGANVLVLASEHYDPEDYIWDVEDFTKWVRSND